MFLFPLFKDFLLPEASSDDKVIGADYTHHDD